MSDHIVTGRGNGHVFPYVVATNRHQRAILVDTVLTTLAGALSDARLHHSAYFYVGERPMYEHAPHEVPKRWLRVGVYDGFGGVFFCDENGSTERDWAWAALAPQPVNGPVVYFDQDAETEFPPQTVMPLDQLRAIVLEWAKPVNVPTRWNGCRSTVSCGDSPKTARWTYQAGPRNHT